MVASSDAEKKSPQLLPEIWNQVISHLYRPRPRPTGTNKPASIRQPELATLMRINKMFNNLTATHLYTDVVTDHLPSLVLGIQRPAQMTEKERMLDMLRSRHHAHEHGVDPHLCCDHRPSYVPGANQRAAATGIKSKFELLGHTKRLYIEYFDKSEPSYVSLLSLGGALFDLVHPTFDSKRRSCELECRWLQDAAERLEMVKQDLTSLSTAVYLGGQTALWQDLEGEQGSPIARAISNNSMAMLTLAGRAKGSISICGRAVHGPLRIASGILAMTNAKVQHFAHCESYLGTLPCFPGNQSNWICSFKLVDKDRKFRMETARYYLSQMVEFHLKRREGLIQDPSVFGYAHIYSITFDIYLPATLMKPVAQASIRKAIKEAETRAKADLGVPAGKYRDEWRLKSIETAPTCQACFWEPSDLANEAIDRCDEP